MKENIKTLFLLFIAGAVMGGGIKTVDCIFRSEVRLYICTNDDTKNGTEKCKVFK
jgi:hypothetical protein